jgi:transcriptional regulator with XRE-family HTH domain
MEITNAILTTTAPTASPLGTPPGNAPINAPVTLGGAATAAMDTQINAQIATRLKALRAERALTLQDLAASSGVSRAMISKIERAEASATAALLHRLCTALGIRLSDLLVPVQSRPSAVMRRSQRMRWQDPATGFVREIVTPRMTGSRVEVVEVTLPPKALVRYGPAMAGDAPSPAAAQSPQGAKGYSQHIIAHTAGLRVTQFNALGHPPTTTDLIAGDALFMWAEGSFSFENLLDTPCQYLVIIDHTPQA